MITKVDNPQRSESRDYNNKGSSSRLKNYLIGNEDKIDKDDLFFDFEKENIQGDEMQRRIDENVKGLKNDDHKFFSLSINPSTEELAWIKNDKEKFKEFVKESMINYAKSFKHSEINKSQLVWGAIIHEKRFYTEKEVYVYKKKNPDLKLYPFKAGDPKPGNQMHAHVIVSARDRNMETSLNCLTALNKLSRKFSLKGWQKMNQDSFQKMFYYKNGVNIYVETQKKVVAKKIEQLERLGFQPQDTDKIYRVGEKMNFDAKYTRNLNRLVHECYNGNAIVETEKYLELGDKKYREEYPEGFREGGFERVENESKKEEWNQLLMAANDISHISRGQKQDGSEFNKRRRKRRKGL